MICKVLLVVVVFFKCEDPKIRIGKGSRWSLYMKSEFHATLIALNPRVGAVALTVVFSELPFGAQLVDRPI